MSKHCSRIEPLLSAWLDRSLRGGERTAVAAHLPNCPRCQAEVASLQRTSALLRAAPARSLPPDVRAALLTSAMAAAGVLGSNPPARAALPRLLAVVLAVLAALSVSAWALGDEPTGARVTVPLDVYISDHLQGSSLQAPAPVLVEATE
jgi:anti-sigma factor RsiW